MGADCRPVVEVEEFIARGAERLDVDVDELRSRRRGGGLARAREMLAVLGVERYRLKVKDLARVLQKTPDGIMQATARGARRRVQDGEFRATLNRLDRELAKKTT